MVPPKAFNNKLPPCIVFETCFNCLVYFFVQDTREWTNGVLTVAALEAVDEPVEVNTWIVCDGDIDPEWIESLNSVLVIGYFNFKCFQTGGT